MANDLSIYRTYAPNWWDGSQRFLRLLHNIVPARMAHFTTLVGDWTGKTVLDLGCGGGFMSEALAQEGAHVVGVDPSAPAIEAAQDHAQKDGLKIDYRVGTGERIPLEDGSCRLRRLRRRARARRERRHGAGRDPPRAEAWRNFPLRHDQPHAAGDARARPLRGDDAGVAAAGDARPGEIHPSSGAARQTRARADSRSAPLSDWRRAASTGASTSRSAGFPRCRSSTWATRACSPRIGRTSRLPPDPLPNAQGGWVRPPALAWARQPAAPRGTC